MILDKVFKNEKGEPESFFDTILGANNPEDYIYTFAEAKAIKLISDMISKTEIFTYELQDKKIKDIKNNIYWRLNIQPNFIETGARFRKKLATKLLIDKKVLILMNKYKEEPHLLYVADSFDSSKDIYKGKSFKNIKLCDDEGNTFNVNKEYTIDNSIYITLNDNSKARANFKIQSGKILSTIIKKYKRSNSEKWKLKRPGDQMPVRDAITGKQFTYDDYKDMVSQGLLTEEDVIIMLSEKFDLINLNKDNSQSLADYKDMIKIIGDTVASSYGIPLDIFYGNKTEKSTGNEDFITFAVEPIMKLIEDGFNIGVVGKENYLKGEKVEFNRQRMQYINVLDKANSIDKLTADGFSRNEINKLLGLPHIPEKWADEHHITKNYEVVEGGAKNGE